MEECLHRTIQRLLPDAVGESELVVVANVDVRGFTRFSETQDSVLALMYIRKVYESILRDYFSSATFFKLTGDGLLLIFPWSDDSLKTVINGVIKDCLRLVTDFPTLVSDDPAISFKVPDNVGIGLARGAASRLRAKRTILDYSGRPLNLASRLMEFARPGGVVTDANFGIELLRKETREKFIREEVFVPSLAEREPMPIHYTSGYTKMSPKAKVPIVESDWERIEEEQTLRYFRELGPVFEYFLPSIPVEEDEISVVIRTPIYRAGKPMEDLFSSVPVGFDYELQAGQPCLTLRYDTAVAAIKSEKVPWSRPAVLHIDYPKL